MKKFGLSADERIKKKSEIGLVYSEGSLLVSKKNLLKATYFSETSGEQTVKIAVGIHKKSGNAVWRNRLKRLIKESYRLNNSILFDSLSALNKRILIVFSANKLNYKTQKKIYLRDVEEEVIDLLEKIKSSV